MLDEVATAVASAGALTEGLATRQTLLDAGVSGSALSRAVERRDVHRVGRGVYGSAPLPPWPEHALKDGVLDPAFLAHARARLLEVGIGAVLTARSAALLWGLEMLVEPAAVEVQVQHVRKVRGAHRARTHRGVQGTLPDVMQSSIPVLTAEATVISCAEALPLVEAVVIADSALRAGAVTVKSLTKAVAGVRGQGRWSAAQAVLAMVDVKAESVLESALRVRLLQAGVTGLESQLVVRSKRRRILRVDLAFARERLAVETDGKRWHQDLVRDQRTGNAMAACGWRVLRYGWVDVVHDWARVVDEVLEAMAA